MSVEARKEASTLGAFARIQVARVHRRSPGFVESIFSGWFRFSLLRQGVISQLDHLVEESVQERGALKPPSYPLLVEG